MNGELVSTQTTDGLTLHGFLLRSEENANPNVDLLIFVHGVGSNFYQSSLVRKTWSQFSDSGLSILSVNTRGHDFVFGGGLSKANTWLGSASETVDECRLDLASWITRAKKMGFGRIVLFGHSLGAIKAIYSQALEPHPDLVATIAVSPSCLSCSSFQQSSRAVEFQNLLDWASQQVASGNADKIEEVSFPFRLMMSPRTFYDKYGPEERYNILKLVEKVNGPLFLVFGELEVSGENPAFRHLDERVRARIESKENASMKVLKNADHYYSGVQPMLAETIIEWVGQL